jgi:hypothetical protein
MNFNEFLSLAVAFIILAIIGVVTLQVLPQVKSWLTAHLSQKERDLLDAIFAKIASAVEYERLKKAAEGAAFDALKYALFLADLYLKRYGIDLDEELILAMLRKYLQEQISFETNYQPVGSAARSVVQSDTSRYWA